MKAVSGKILDIYELSPIQQGMLFHSLLAPDSGVYFEQVSLDFRGTLNSAALQHAWQKVVDRHPILRTSFYWEEVQKPLQVVNERVSLPWVEEDWRGLSAADLQQRKDAFLIADRACGFELSKSPLMRMTLLRLGESDWQLVWSFHHILLDGWCASLLLQEVSRFYEAYQQGEVVELPRSRPYRDYIGWLQQQDLKAAESYWKERLAGFTKPTMLGVELARGEQREAGYGQSERYLTASSTRALEALAREQQVTLNTVIQGAWAVLMSRYSGERDVVYGVTVSGRPAELAGVDQMIGLFINTLPMRVQIESDAEVGSWLQRLQAEQAEMRQYEYSPLVEVQGWSEVERGVGLFETLLAYENYPIKQAASEQNGPEQEVKYDQLSSMERTNYSLTMLVGPGERLMLRAPYDKQRYSAETIERVLVHFEQVLVSMTAGGQQRVRELRMLSAAEERQIVAEWNDTEREYPQEVCIHELFAEQARRTPEAIAVVAEDEQVSYRELDQRANQVANQLQTLGAGPEVVVGICVERSVAMVVGLLGTLKAGGAYLPLDAEYPRERLEYMIEDAGVSVLLTQRELRERLPQQVSAQVVYLDSEELWASSVEEPQSSVNSGNLAYLLYTSGSTGRPKAVAVEHRSAVALLSWAQTVFDEEALDGVLASTSINFDLSVFELFVPLSRGGKVIVAANALQLGELAGREEVRLINTVPSAMRELVRSGQVPESVRVVNLAGEALSRSLVEEIYGLEQVQEVNNLYGPTEDTTYSTWERVGRDEDGAVRIGKPIANTRAYVLDAEQQVVPVGVRGELYLGGAGLGRGYWGRAELTAERFVPDGVSGRSGERLYRTGDEVRYGSDGRLEYVGRLDQQVKVRGYRIELGEVEEALARHESIRESVVVVRDEQLVGYVVAAEGATVEVNELRAYLGEQLPGYMIPGVLVEMAALPLTANGKVDRKALPEPGQMDSGGEYVGPRTAVEELVAGIWSEVLGVERVGIHDNFFELGGHSLLAMQVISRVRESFKVELPLQSVFEAPTLSEFSSHIETALGVEQFIAPDITRVDRDRDFPLSFAQQRLWFLDQLEGTGSAYNIPGTICLSGELDIPALERSVSEIVKRHEVLRTVFVAEHGQPKQVILPEVALNLTIVDLRQDRDQESRVREHALREAQRSFNLRTGPLMRMTVLQLSEGEHVLLFTMHHIISDAWSMGVLVKEISSLYEAYRQGKESPLAELEIQYADYAVWQRTWLQGAMLEQQMGYWREQLQGVAPVLELPVDRARPNVQSFRGATEQVKLSRRLSQALKSLSASEDLTLYMTLLTAFQILLARYAGKEDIALGSPIAGRSRKEVENLIGFFVNTLVLRTQVARNLTIQQLMRRVRETALGAYSHQDIPFEQLIDALKVVRQPGTNPLVQVMFTLQNTPQEFVAAQNLQVLPLDVTSGTAKFDLTLSIMETNEGLIGGLQYSTDLFDEVTIKRMLNHYERILEEMVSNPQQRVGELCMLTGVEKQQVVAEWNETEREYARESCIHELFAEQARRRPEAVAVIADGEQVSYGELDQRANQVARRLQQLGVGPEGVVGICVERSVAMVVGLLGILKAGGAYLPLDAEYPRERLAYMLFDAGVKVVLTQSELRERLPLSTGIECLELSDWFASEAGEWSPLESGASAETLAYVIYTSGSTGQPKGVAVPHRGVVRLVQQSNYVKLDEEEVVLQLAPVSFDASTFEIWGALLNGARLVVMAAGQPSLAEIAETVRRHEVSTMWLTAGLFQVMATEQLESLREVKQLLAGGDVLNVRAVQAVLDGEAGERVLINGYGPTENTTFSCCHVMRAGEEVTGESVPIGQPITNSTAYVLDEQLRPVPVGVRGELYLGGDGLARGYVGRAELTAERFVPDGVSGRSGERLYRTGDVVRWNAEGVLAFVGRADQQVKVRGYRIELGEIEEALAGYEGISESVVVVRTEGEGEKRLVGYVVARAELEVSELRAYLETKLPAYMIPSVFVELTELPLTANGKVDRKALAAAELELAGKREYEAPSSEVERVLARIWAEVLGVERVGIHDNFFEIGGDSILGIQVISRANQVGLRLSPKDVFQHQTVAQLATVAGTAAEVVAEQGLVMGPVSLTPIQHWFFEQKLNEPHHFNQSVLLEVKQSVKAELLTEAARQLVLHHDGLRLRFERSESGWNQYHAEAAEPVSFTTFDLSTVPASEQSAAIEAETVAVQASLNMSAGPLVRFVYFDLGEGQPARLLLVCHHLVVDGVSWRILLEDLQRVCDALLAGEAVQLPAKSTSYQQWAEAVTVYAASAAVQQQMPYWLQTEEVPLQGLPRDYEGGENLIRNTGVVGVSLSREETEALLQEVPGVYHTQINEVLLSALTVALGQWSGQQVVLVDMEGHGREAISEQVEVSRTVGWFTTIYPVLLEVKGRLREVGEVVKQVKEQVRAIPEQGMGYGMLRYLGEASEQLRELPQAEVVFNYTGQFDQTLSESGLFRAGREDRGEGRSGANQRAHLLEVTGGVAGGQLQMTWSYSEQIHKRETVERVAADFIEALRDLIQQCQWGEVAGFTPSDFEDFQWSQHELDDITEVIRSL
jgi:amino acid adenylation domain-containing protein/non-ribosomal peptide synthase protein (TIGR01720 family)